MKLWRSAAVLLAAAVVAVRAADIILVRGANVYVSGALQGANTTQTHESQYSQQCSGMYSKKSWGGKIEPFIMVKFIETDKPQPVEDPTVAVMIWEWQDSNLLGLPADAVIDKVRT